jgi:hypothetical protein
VIDRQPSAARFVSRSVLKLFVTVDNIGKLFYSVAAVAAKIIYND